MTTTPTLREAAQQALEALENFTRDDVCEASHHSKDDRHGPLSECPVAERFVATVEGLRAALAEQAAEQAEPVAADHARKELSDMLMSFAVIRELTETQQDSAEETVEAVRGALNSASTYFAERNSARDAFWRRVKQCEELEAKLAADAPPAPARQEWQPIETAPKDKRVLAVVDGVVRTIRWGKTSHVPLYGWCLADQGAEDFDLCEPTLWQPLPAAPITTAPAEGEKR